MVAKVQDVIDLPEELGAAADDGDTDVGAAGVADGAGAPTLTPAQLRSQLLLLVQSLVDALPDETAVFARQLVEEGRHGAAAGALLFDALRFRLQVTPVEHAVLTECLAAAGESTGFMDYVPVSDEARPLLYTFSADPPATDVYGRETSAQLVRSFDERVLVEVAAQPSVVGVWRAWRFPATDSPWPLPRPTYLVEVSDPDGVDQLTRAFYGPASVPVRAGDPVVEVYVTGNDLPGLHRAVQFSGVLLRPDEGDADFTFVDVFEGDPGPDGAPQQVVTVGGDVAERMLRYMAAGKPLMMADTAGDDLLAPERVGQVPLHLRTDGVWIWSDASEYYLREHGAAPPRAFAEHLQQSDGLPGHVTDATLHQAVAWLQTEE